MPRKGFSYSSEAAVVCQDCGRSFKSPQGLSGHLSFGCDGTGEVATGQPVSIKESQGYSAGEADEIRRARLENEQNRLENQRLRLLNEQKRLQEEQSAPPAKDVAAELGMGDMTPEIKTRVQSRGFGFTPDTTQEKKGETSPLVKMAQEAEALDKIRGGRQDGNGKTGLESALHLLGCNNLFDLVGKLGSTSTTTSGGIKIGSLELPAGSIVSESTLGKIIDNQGTIEAARLEKEGKESMSGAAEGLGKILLALVAEKTGLAGIISPPSNGGQSIQGPGPDPGPGAIFTCPECDAETPFAQVPADGTKIICSACEKTFTAHLDEPIVPPPPQHKPKRQKPLPPREQEQEPAQTIECLNCKQLIVLQAGSAVGETVACPSCQTEIELYDPEAINQPLPAGVPSQKTTPETSFSQRRMPRQA